MSPPAAISEISSLPFTVTLSHTAWVDSCSLFLNLSHIIGCMTVYMQNWNLFLEEREILLIPNIVQNKGMGISVWQRVRKHHTVQVPCHINPVIWRPTSVVEKNNYLDVLILFFHLECCYSVIKTFFPNFFLNFKIF